MLTRKTIVGMIMLCLISTSGTAWGTQYYVDSAGDDSDGSTWAKAFHTIQQGIDASGATVVDVNEGTYTEKIDFKGKAVTVRKVSRSGVDEAIIDAQDTDANVVTFDSGEGADSVLTGFTLTGGKYGVYCGSSSAATVINCVIMGNDDSGVYLSGAGTAEIRSNTIVDNTSAGVYVASGNEPNVINCILWNNSDDLYDCTATYSCIEDGDTGTGNISSYPYFADYDGNDFHLTWNSPCINRGDPNGSYAGEKDIDGEDRVATEEFVDARVDMGADELNVHNIELVKNPGFEDGNDAGGVPLHWTDGWPSISKSLDPNEKHSGSYSWKFTNNGTLWSGAYSDPIAVEHGKTYKLSAWIKCSPGMERNDLAWEHFKADGNSLNIYYKFKANTPGLDEWTEYGALRATEQADVNHIKIRFFGPTMKTGTVWWDDFSVTEQVEFLPPYGRANTNDVKTIDFGVADDNDPNYHGGITWNTLKVGERKTDSGDGNINYREIEGYSSLTSSHPLRLEIPAFNVDANGFPLTPMLLEILYKDTVPATEAVVYSKIDYIDLDPNYLQDPNRHYPIAHLGDCNDYRWKYMQYAFQESDYQLLRAIDDDNDGEKEFVIKITASKIGLLIPIDYISLRKITQAEYQELTGKQRAMRGFFETELPIDAPSPPVSYDDPNLTVFVRDVMRPVYEHTKPGPNEPNDVNGFGCWGEVEPVSFSLYSENGVNDLTITASNLTYASDSNYIIDNNAISMYQVVYEETRLEDYLVKSYALLPDRLEEFASLSVDPNSSKRIWLKIQVPDEYEGLPAGLYEGQVTIQRTGEPNAIVPIDFTVYDITLDGPGFTNPVWYDPYVMSSFNNLEGVFEAYKEVYVDPFISSEPHLIQVGPDKVIFDSNNFEEALGRMINEGFAKGTAVIWMNHWYFRDLYDLVMETDYKDVINDPNLYFYLSDANFAEAFGSLVEKHVEVGDACGIQFIFFVDDEPGDDPYRRIISDRLLSIIKDPNYVDPNYDVKTAATYYSICDELLYLDPNDANTNPNGYELPDEFDYNLPALTELVDYKIWPMGSVGTGYSKHQDPNYTGFFGYYTTHHATTRNPVYNRFLHGLFAFRTEPASIWLWAMHRFSNDPFNDFDTHYSYILPFTYPDFIFAYPTWSGELLYTIGGLEGIREGIKDAKYIATLKRLIEEDPGDPCSQDANDYLQEVESSIQSDFRAAYHYKTTKLGYYEEILQDISDNNDANDFEAFTRIRKNIAEYIVLVANSLEEYPVHNLDQDKWYTTINAAIDDANSGDEIVVNPGTQYESIDFDGKAITLRSTHPNDPNVVAATIIDANGSGTVVTFDSSEDANSVLKGFTITGGSEGGIYCYGASPTIADCIIKDNGSITSDSGGMYNHSSSPTVTNCVFSGNTSDDDGGGMYNHSSSPTVTNCIFSNNTGEVGGGMFNRSGSCPTVTNCVFSGNTSDHDGGGMCNWSANTSPTVINCVFYDNSASSEGGGMHNDNSSPTVINCLFYKNTADEGGGMANDEDCFPTISNCTFFENYATDSGGGINNERDSFPELCNCIFWGNDAYEEGEEIYNDDSEPSFEHCCIEGGLNGSKCGGDDSDSDGGNIDDDPNFVDSSDPNGADNIWGTCDDGLRLPSDSPCVDEGEDDCVDVTTDIKGSDREIGPYHPDMGAYEYDPNC